MTCIRRRSAASFWAFLLLVLAASPVTAPFSSCDFGALFSSHDAQSGGILQAKTAKDESSAVLIAVPFVLLVESRSFRCLVRPTSAATPSDGLDIPLRL